MISTILKPHRHDCSHVANRR